MDKLFFCIAIYNFFNGKNNVLTLTEFHIDRGSINFLFVITALQLPLDIYLNIITKQQS